MNLKNETEWLSNKAPWEMTTKEFIDLHYTGHISSGTYQSYEEKGGLSWLGTQEKYPVLHAEINGVTYRRSGEVLRYCATDSNSDIIRDEAGRAVYLTPDEILEKKYPTHDQTILAFVGGEPIGLVSNEFGAVGVWVEAEHQRKGIGVTLLKFFIDENKGMRIGQMTNAGYNAVARLHEKYVEEFNLSTKTKPKCRP